MLRAARGELGRAVVLGICRQGAILPDFRGGVVWAGCAGTGFWWGLGGRSGGRMLIALGIFSGVVKMVAILSSAVVFVVLMPLERALVLVLELELEPEWVLLVQGQFAGAKAGT